VTCCRVTCVTYSVWRRIPHARITYYIELHMKDHLDIGLCIEERF
jgi:hypothetical protein